MATPLASRLFLYPLNHGNLRPAVEAKRQERPAQATVDVQPVPTGLVPACDTAIAPRRKPEGGNARYPPLSTVTVPAENQINGMVRFDEIQDVRRMGQQQRNAMVRASRHTPKIGSMQRGIIDPGDHQLSLPR